MARHFPPVAVGVAELLHRPVEVGAAARLYPRVAVGVAEEQPFLPAAQVAGVLSQPVPWAAATHPVGANILLHYMEETSD